MYLSIYVYMYIYTYVSIYIYTCVCVCVCAYIPYTAQLLQHPRSAPPPFLRVSSGTTHNQTLKHLSRYR